MNSGTKTTSTGWMYLMAWLRVGDPPLWIKDAFKALPWIWGFCGLTRVFFGPRVGPWTEMIFGLTLMLTFYFIDRTGNGRKGEPSTAYHPVHPLFRASGLIAGVALFLEGLQGVGK